MHPKERKCLFRDEEEYLNQQSCFTNFTVDNSGTFKCEPKTSYFLSDFSQTGCNFECMTMGTLNVRNQTACLPWNFPQSMGEKGKQYKLIQVKIICESIWKHPFLQEHKTYAMLMSKGCSGQKCTTKKQSTVQFALNSRTVIPSLITSATHKQVL